MGVMLGVAVLIIVISVMSGFDAELREKVFGFTAHLRVVKYELANGKLRDRTMPDYASVMNIVASNKNVAGVSPNVIGQVMLETQPTNGQALLRAPLVRGIDQTEGMAGETIHVAVAVRGAARTEQNGHLMQRFGRQRPEIPHHGGGFQVGIGAALLGVDEVTELQGIANKEDRGIVPHHVPVALFGVELHGETARIAFGIAGTLLAANRREPDEHVGFLADFTEEFRGRVVRDVFRHRENAVGAGTLGVYDSLRDALAVEVRHLFEKLEVLHQHRAAGTGGHGILVIADRASGSGSDRFLVAHSTSILDELTDRGSQLLLLRP